MQVKELIGKINQSVEELDFVSARIFIERNYNVVADNKQYLKRNAREILNFLTEQLNAGVQPLSRRELMVIKAINEYANKFDLSGIKLLLKDNPKLFFREDVASYLNKDARIILDGMGVTKKQEQENVAP